MCHIAPCPLGPGASSEAGIRHECYDGSMPETHMPVCVPYHDYTLPGFPWPPSLTGKGCMPTLARHVLLYLKAFSQHHGLQSHIRLNCRVQSVEEIKPAFSSSLVSSTPWPSVRAGRTEHWRVMLTDLQTAPWPSTLSLHCSRTLIVDHYKAVFLSVWSSHAHGIHMAYTWHTHGLHMEAMSLTLALPKGTSRVPRTERWRVVWTDLQTAQTAHTTASFLVVATGLYSAPYIPAYPVSPGTRSQVAQHEL
ncbi:hypothetical protein HaLaN_20133 [Haematococcus lacustris]|uniref:indole-3-pyruvate monooxygenase n=1 Tax=Haematococcus lacustris TaxID=44745 RepID=A0A699ZWK1_HAELA|nr:hypothetical protein HaLaN_20133 [Haematococcus lacustris]